MNDEKTIPKYLQIVKFTSWLVFVLGVIYAVTTLIGLLNINTSAEPIGQPFLFIMELLTILIAPLMAISMIGVHYYTEAGTKMYSLAAVCMMLIMTGITSAVHFVVLTISYHEAIIQLPGYSFLFSYKWPSIVYALDILAWDWFYALSMFFAAATFRKSGLEKNIRLLMIISGLLSLIGLLGIPFANMQIRNIGIVGYAVIGPIVFLLIGLLMNRKSHISQVL